MTKIFSKDEKVTLDSLSDTPVSQLVFGAAWQGKHVGLVRKLLKKDKPIDLDFSCIMYDDDGQTHDTVWYANLKSRDGSVWHNGDDTTGENGGIDEAITINLQAVPDKVHCIFFVISSFSGESFAECDECNIQIQNASGNIPLGYYAIKAESNKTAKIMLRMKREENGWTIKAIGKACEGKNIQDLYGTLRRELYA